LQRALWALEWYIAFSDWQLPCLTINKRMALVLKCPLHANFPHPILIHSQKFYQLNFNFYSKYFNDSMVAFPPPMDVHQFRPFNSIIKIIKIKWFTKMNNKLIISNIIISQWLYIINIKIANRKKRIKNRMNKNPMIFIDSIILNPP
jgi:hypothetical protein